MRMREDIKEYIIINIAIIGTMFPIGCLIIFSLWFVKVWNNIERRWD
jgi:hypothetical protein